MTKLSLFIIFISLSLTYFIYHLLIANNTISLQLIIWSILCGVFATLLTYVFDRLIRKKE
jgi:hypothetical protein